VTAAPLLGHVVSNISVGPPKLSMAMFHYRPPIEQLSHAVGAMFKCSRQFHLPGLLQRRFEARSAPIIHARCMQLPHGIDKKPLCMTCGVCVHEGKGLTLWKVRNACLAAMKSVFKPNTSLRHKLADGFIVLKCSGIIDPVDGIWSRREAIKSGIPVDGAQKDVWLHVSHMSFSPYQPSWLLMTPVATDQCEVGHIGIPQDPQQ
jgi:hypothetical protein